MNTLEFTNCELTHLHNALSIALSYGKKNFFTWSEVSKKNPSASACVKLSESEIDSYSELIKKIESVRGF